MIGEYAILVIDDICIDINIVMGIIRIVSAYISDFIRAISYDMVDI